MRGRKKPKSTTDETSEILKDLLIVQLGLANVPQPEIRKIVGCDMHRVNKIVRQLKKSKGKPAQKEKK